MEIATPNVPMALSPTLTALPANQTLVCTITPPTLQLVLLAPHHICSTITLV